MSYTSTEWKTGDVITADKLNNIEQGIVNSGSGLFVINATGVASQDNPRTTPTLDKTYNEIKAALDAGMTLVIRYAESSPVGEATAILPLQFKISSGIQEEGDYLSFSQTGVSFLTNCADVRLTVVEVSKRGSNSTYTTQKLAFYTGS